MGKEKEALQFIYSQVAEEVSKMYEKYKRKCGLEDENDTEKQLEILIAKKYISKSFRTDLMLISDYYLREMYTQYIAGLSNYKMRILFLLDSIQ